MEWKWNGIRMKKIVGEKVVGICGANGMDFF